LILVGGTLKMAEQRRHVLNLYSFLFGGFLIMAEDRRHVLNLFGGTLKMATTKKTFHIPL
jgi:hypothetical protein